jgi:hypothetical protein
MPLDIIGDIPTSSLSYENREICMKYRKMMYNSEDFIDIPQEVDSEEFFRSTVGHKVHCLHFRGNGKISLCSYSEIRLMLN